MPNKVNLKALTAAGDALRYALASYLRVAVDYRLITRADADAMIAAPDRAFPIFGTVEKALSRRKRQGAYMDLVEDADLRDEAETPAEPAKKARKKA